MKEADAFRRIQRLSMNGRKPIRYVAEAILPANSLELRAADDGVAAWAGSRTGA